MFNAALSLCLCLPIVLAFQQLDSFHGKYHLQAKQFSNEFDNFDPQFPVMKKNRLGNPWIPQRLRPQRNRKNDVTRSFVRENVVTARDFIYPIHIHEDKQDVEIFSMPGCMKFSLPGMMKEVEDAMRFGIKAFLLLPYIADNIKTNFGEESYNPDGLVPRAIKLIKAKYPDVVVSTEVGLHHYLPMGHDAIVMNNRVVNDMTVEKLQKQAVMQAKAGSDMVVPSDMMDGRTGAIRDALDYEGFTNVSILACTASYDSVLCCHDHKSHSTIKKSYDVDPANSREVLLEASLEFSEGADMLMVKPATLYLDIIHRLKHHTFLPMVAYHTCGEYAMLKSVAQRDWLDEKETVMESMLCLKRAGADIIISHYAKQVAKWINEDDHRM